MEKKPCSSDEPEPPAAGDEWPTEDEMDQIMRRVAHIEAEHEYNLRAGRSVVSMQRAAASDASAAGDGVGGEREGAVTSVDV